MKGECKIYKLGDVCDVINGLWTGKKEPFINICVIRNTNFTKDCKLNLDDVAYIDAEVKQFSTRKLQVGDIIVEKSGGSDKQPVGRVVLFDVGEGDYSFSNFTSALRVKGDIDPKYLHKCLVAHYRRGETEKLQSKTTGIRNLDMKGYLRLPIPIRPLPEQERIVAELDCLSDIIEKQKQQLKELDNLAQSIFYTTFGDPISNNFGWEVKKLEDIAYIGLGFTHTPQYVDKGVAFLSVKDISGGEICWDDIRYVSEEEYISAPKGAKPNKGDIMFCRVGTMGKPVIVNTDQPFCTFVSVGYLHLLDRTIINQYVKYWMQSKSFDVQVAANVKGLAIKNLNTGWLKKFEIQTPPLHLQQEFASKIEAIEKQKEIIKQSIAETETLFNSRMDYYFN